MLLRFSLLIGLGSLAIGPVLADIVNVTVNGSVSGSVALAVGCSPVTPGCTCGLGGCFFPVVDSFSGTFSASGSAVDPFDAGTSVDASAAQNITATADALEISLSGNYNGSPAPAFTSVQVNDSVAVSFDLTEESTIQFNDPPVDLSNTLFNGELLDSKGNVILVVEPFGGSPSGGFSASTVLQRGTYQLDASVMVFATGGVGQGLGGFFGADLNTNFTPVVPEPRLVILATLLATILCSYVQSRRHRVS